MEWPLKGPLRLKLQGDNLQGGGFILQVADYIRNQISCGTRPQEEEYVGPRNEVGVGVAALSPPSVTMGILRFLSLQLWALQALRSRW